jgi:hypothetical protein
LVALNQRIRADVPDWPAWLFVVGQAEGDASGYAIDTRNSESSVWWLDHMHLGPASGPSEGRFTDWFSRRVADISPEKTRDRSVLWFLLMWIGTSVAALIGVLLWLARATKRLRERNK